MYTEQQLKEKCLEYFSGDSLAADVWIKKYALQDNDNNYLELTPDDTHKRLAKEFAKIEAKYPNSISEDEIYNLFKNFKYIIPQGSPMEGIGNNFRIQSLSNCFVIEPPADSYGGILKTDQEQVQLMKRRGGVGFDISPIRPKGAKTKNAAKTTDGISIFMERFSNSTREVAQNGRRGALLISISIQHTEIETFIDIKKDLKRITGANISIRISDAFMNAVKNDENFMLQWPVECDNPVITKEVSARKIWNKIIDAAWTSAEPGVLFWDTAKKYTPSDIYKDFGFESKSTNPCITGDTLIAVADGRNAVSIKQLTEEGKDVLVYCLNDKGKLSIKTMRHPRITGYNKPIYKIILENGHEIKVTDNHKFLLTSGEYKQTKDLQYGDSLYILTKYVASIEEIFKNSNSRSSDYWWLKNGNETNKSEHRFIYEQFSNNKIEKGNIIHHKDFNSLNNTFENLKNMSKQQHDNYHGTLIQGKNNPYYKFEHVKKAFDEAAAHVGEKNGRWLDISNEEIISYAKELTQYLQRKISWNELREYVKYTYNKIVPLYFAEYRKKELNNCLEIVALELNIDKNLIFNDFRFIKSYKYALEQYENVKNENGVILVEKICEHCKNKFWVNYGRREISFCSTQCCNYWYNKNTNTNINRTNSLNETYKQKAEKNKLNQIKIYNDIKFKHKKRQPWVEEWEEECKK
jgi:ribonucleoside-diphosphate reductase alpha chain